MRIIRLIDVILSLRLIAQSERCYVAYVNKVVFLHPKNSVLFPPISQTEIPTCSICLGTASFTPSFSLISSPHSRSLSPLSPSFSPLSFPSHRSLLPSFFPSLVSLPIIY